MSRSVERRIPAGRRQRGFSLLELVVIVVLVILLFLAVIDRLLPMRGQAEAAHVGTVIGSLRSAIGLQTAERIVRRGPAAVAELAGVNPMSLLQEWPARYIGEFQAPPGPDIPGGSWHYRADTRELVYRVRYPQYLAGEPAGPVEMRWRVQLQFEDRNQSGRFDPGSDLLTGIRLAPLDDFQWPDQPRGRLRPRA